MKKYSVLFLFLLILQVGCQPQKQFHCYWNNSSGNRLETVNNQGAILYQPADKFTVKVFNNAKNIDVVLATNSPATLQKIYNLGLSVWFDPNGKQRNVFGVNFPMPVASPFTNSEFATYLQRFDNLKLQQEFTDKFTIFETIDTRTQEHTNYNTLMNNNNVRVNITTSNQLLFKYRLTIPLELIYDDIIPEKVVLSIGVTNVNEADKEYYSALSSKQVIQQNLDKLKVNNDKNRQELEEWWNNFVLAPKR